MSPEKIKKYKNKLEAEKEKLSQDIKESEKGTDFGNDIDSFDEETDETEELSNQLALAQNLRNRLHAIEDSLNKIATGNYGICEKCGSNMSETLLDIIPESKLCESCKRIAL